MMNNGPRESGKRHVLADLWVQLWQATIVGAFALAVLDGWAPPEHLPWTRLDLERVDDIDDGGFCVVQGAVRITGGELTPLRPEGLVMRCPLAVRYVIWERQTLRPAAEEILGSPVAGVEAGGYACRRIYGSTDPTSRPSEHAEGNALDVSAIRLEDGRRITVADDWGPIRQDSRAAQLERDEASGLPPLFSQPPSEPTTDEGRFLRRIRDEACDVFGTVLSPEYNEAHRDHLHLDGSRTPLCS